MAIEQLYTLRGATTVGDDTVEEITFASVELTRELLAQNDFKANKLRILQFTASSTSDITAFYPVRAVRESGLVDAPFFSCLEPPIQNGLRKCIRFMLLAASEEKINFNPKHVYLRGAKSLRPDLTKTIPNNERGASR